jgi:RNA polymerase sigma factor (sigma-70 family)
MSDTDLELLARYTRQHAEDAFAEIVRRHLGLVYSAALRQVHSPQLAEEVAQSAFTDLARNAARLKPDTILTAWLYQVTRRTAIDVVRREASRQLREQIATEMNAMHATAADWTHIEPLLDEAMHALDDTDRTAVLLRYFENKSLREVGATLGTSDDAAQKRVSRAVERLREFFAKRGVTVGASGLAVVISANAIQAAPVGLAVSISTAATFAGTAIATATTATVAQAIVMTTLQKSLVSGVLIVAIGAAVYKTREASSLRVANQALQRQQAPLAGQIEKLRSENESAKAQIAALANQLASARTNPSEVLRLRGQVGVLRQENAEIGRKSALSKVTADSDTRKAMRDQQKIGMKFFYGELTKQMNLSPELDEQFHDLLADDVMDNIDLITQSLQDKPGSAEIDRLFSAQEAILRDKLTALIGPDGLEQYNGYTLDLAGRLTALQFDESLTGEKEVKAEKKQQLLQAMREETQAALAATGLPADFQALPMLNFRNIASEEIAEQSLNLMDGVFKRVATRATFLTPDEVNKLQEFGGKAVENNRSMLLMNRKMMAPISE